MLSGQPRYTGGAAFLAAHAGLVALDLSTLVVSIAQLTRLFRDPSALPVLHRFILREAEEMSEEVYDLRPLMTALASTAVFTSGQPRPILGLCFDLGVKPNVFAAAALMPALNTLQLQAAKEGWLDGWMEEQGLPSAFSQLQHFEVWVDHQEEMGMRMTTDADADVEEDEDDDRPREASAKLLLMLQSLAASPLQSLIVCTCEAVVFSSAAMGHIAQFHQLRELHFSVGPLPVAHWAWLDWRDPALFGAYTPNCLPSLRLWRQRTTMLSAEAVVAITSAAPQLHTIDLQRVELSCHPAVFCAIVGGYCPQIEQLVANDRCYHLGRAVQAEDVVEAYQSALAATGRGGDYRPFTQLRLLSTKMCSCALPAVWHALLRLLKAAVRLRNVAFMFSNNPLTICALGYLPSLEQMSAACLWSPSFTAFAQRRSLTQKHSDSSTGVKVEAHDVGCPEPGLPFKLNDTLNNTWTGPPLRLRTIPGLFAAYQRSLSAGHQAVLDRWAAGDFRAGDGRLTAAETPVLTHEHWPVCPHSHKFSRIFGL